uniref:DUF2085 domain-containing protein n=1 Tax=uncultured Bacillota bacterium TaxID=344338 RepID=A0A650EPB0_9FIRM|nr:hypothetical protein Firmicute1046_2470 [uncultured Firmicutes bacterium]
MGVYATLMYLGKLSGCHQLPERSLFICGYQLPVCARCTGAFLGYICGLIMYKFININIWICFLLCGIMFIDWLLQYKEIANSTNKRRLITGFMCGMGYMQVILKIIAVLIYFIKGGIIL